MSSQGRAIASKSEKSEHQKVSCNLLQPGSSFQLRIKSRSCVGQSSGQKRSPATSTTPKSKRDKAQVVFV